MRRLTRACALLLLGTACTTDGGGEPDWFEPSDPCPAAEREILDACHFAEHGDPTVEGVEREDILNCASERLTAPPGGVWWLAGSIADDSVRLASDGGASVALEVVRRPSASPIVGLRVPPGLPPGTRLRLGDRALEVGPARAPLALDDVGLERSVRPDLGGTGFVVRSSDDEQERIHIVEAVVVSENANFYFGVRTIDELGLADAPALCPAAVEQGSGSTFVPVWRGELDPGLVIGVYLVDPDDDRNGRLERL